jgi:gluconolactonase
MLARRPPLSFLLVAASLVAAGACAPTEATAPPPAAAAAAAPPVLLPGAGIPRALPSPVPFVSLEGPLWVAAGPYLLFSDVVEKNAAGAVIYRFDPVYRRFSIFPYPAAESPGPTSTNGLAVDAAGDLVACERYNGRLVRVSPEGKRTVLADAWPPSAAGHAGLALNAPNDLVLRADGNIYFTDTDWGARPGTPHPPMAVYRVSPAGVLTLVLAMQKPNGIALSPDGGTLYIGSDTQAKVWKLPLDDSGAVAGGAGAGGGIAAPTVLIDGARVPGGFKVPDGICVDDAGDLYIANNSDEIKAIEVFDAAGEPLGRIPFPAAPSNCTFGGADRRTLYVTTLHAVYEVRVPVPGLP